MTKVVFDTNLFVSAFLTRHYPGGVSTELLRFAYQGTFDLHISAGIVAEVLETLSRNPRTQANYRYTPQMAEQFCSDLLDFAIMVNDPPPLPGAVPRDPDDDMIIACAVAAGAEYLVTRDKDLLSLGNFGAVRILAPEEFLKLIRSMK
jgi:putative PIN family toxin of toxin-antitoxin system